MFEDVTHATTPAEDDLIAAQYQSYDIREGFIRFGNTVINPGGLISVTLVVPAYVRDQTPDVLLRFQGDIEVSLDNEDADAARRYFMNSKVQVA